MDNGGSNGGGSFEVEHGSDAAEVTNVHEAGAREVGDVIREVYLLSHLRLSAAMRILDSLPVFCITLVMYCINCYRRSSNRATPCGHGPITVSFPCLTTCLRNASLPGCYTNKLCFPLDLAI